jgi:hypothetical protein
VWTFLDAWVLPCMYKNPESHSGATKNVHPDSNSKQIRRYDPRDMVIVIVHACNNYAVPGALVQRNFLLQLIRIVQYI